MIAFYLVDVGWNQMMQTGDDRYLNSLIHSAYYSFFVVSIEIILGLLIAYALFQKIKGKQFFQMFIFMPYITPAVMASTVFLIKFSNRETSLANNIIHFFGITHNIYHIPIFYDKYSDTPVEPNMQSDEF